MSKFNWKDYITIADERIARISTLFLFVLTLVMIGVMWFMSNRIDESRRIVDEVEFMDSVRNYHKLYYDKEFNGLLEENKELYDSLLQYREQVEYLVQFTYKKEYKTGVVETDKEEKDEDAVTYEYASEPNDTFSYTLKVNSSEEPNWYELNVLLKDRFTIVNRNEEGSDFNHIVIESEGKGDIEDVTVFKRKDKKKITDKLKDKIAIGPSVTYGYDVQNHTFGPVVGVSVTYDLW